jgi:predicted membrane metal-binding protein
MKRIEGQPQDDIEPRHEYRRPPSYTSHSEIGHWVRTAGILAPLVIGELVKDPDKKWRFIRITSVAMALISEGLHARRIQNDRKEREAQCER